MDDIIALTATDSLAITETISETLSETLPASIFENQSFMSMAGSVLFWLVLFIAVSILNSKAGIGKNLLKTAIKRIGKLRKTCLELNELFRTRSKRVDSHKTEQALRILNRILLQHKRTTKLLAVYLFDDKEDRDVIEAKKLVDEVPTICRKIISAALDGKIEGKEAFIQIEDNLKRAKESLKKALSLDIKKELLKIE